MKKGRIAILVAVVLFAITAVGADFRASIKKSEELWLEDKISESDKALDEAMAAAETPDQKAEVLWRKARNLYDSAEAMSREAKKQRMNNYVKMQELTKKCAQLSPKTAECYMYLATGIGRESTQKGILNSLGSIKKVEDLYLKVISLKPTYRSPNGEANTLGDAYYALGIFYRLVPDWSFLQVMYKTRGDKKKSIEMQRKAVQIEPKRIEYVKELGVSLICYGKETKNQKAVDEGVAYLKKVQNMTEYKSTDKIDKEHARMILGDLNMACGYSRDAQQDVSKDSYNKNK